METTVIDNHCERIAEQIARNPEAFDFNDIALPTTQVEVRASLEVMVGGFTEEIVTGEGVFYVRPPKLREQRELLKVKRELDTIPVDAPDADERFLDALIGLAQCVLYVRSAGETRRATEDEIASAFSAVEVQEVVARATGWKAQEGEQSHPPTL